MDEKPTGSPFDHGAFWDRYSEAWAAGSVAGPGATGSGPLLGTEWGVEAHARSIIDRFVTPHLRPAARVLEIGPGGGKFSRLLQPLCAELLLADISPAMLERAATSCPKPSPTILLDGESLQPLADGSLDLVFSFDVFIHLESEEVFRYLAEVNRVLAPGGIFVVHTSTFESSYGWLSFFRQIRDHRPLIGQRYGGRMYPMSAAILRRFVEHSGFAVVDASGDWENRDIVMALRRTHPAWLWKFMVEPPLREAFECCERSGGADGRPLFAVHDRRTGQMATLLVGDPADPCIIAAAQAVVPARPGLARSIGVERLGGVGIVRFPYVRGPALSVLLAGADVPLAASRPVWRMVLELIDDLIVAHEHGLVHGEISPRSILVDVEVPKLVLAGLVDPVVARWPRADRVMAQDRAALAEMLTSLPIPGDLKGAIGRAANDFAAGRLSARSIGDLRRRLT